MEKRIIFRGVLVGALGGLLAFIFGRIFTEPVINRAIDYESGRDDAEMALNKAAGLPMGWGRWARTFFSRSVQQNVGIGIGMILFGVAMGALFAVVYSVTVGRVGTLSPRNLALAPGRWLFLGVYAGGCSWGCIWCRS